MDPMLYIKIKARKINLFLKEIYILYDVEKFTARSQVYSSKCRISAIHQRSASIVTKR